MREGQNLGTREKEGFSDNPERGVFTKEKKET